jgi:2-hydroxychromene-2-carboxylate isomerase
VVIDMATRAAAANQPYIHRLTRLGCAAAEAGRGLPFLKEVSHTIWSGGIDNWYEGEHLAHAATRAGVDLAELDRKIAADPDKYEAIAQENQDALRACGHWGVPTMAFEGEPFFGQDRLDVLLWRLKQRGLRKR